MTWHARRPDPTDSDPARQGIGPLAVRGLCTYTPFLSHSRAAVCTVSAFMRVHARPCPPGAASEASTRVQKGDVNENCMYGRTKQVATISDETAGQSAPLFDPLERWWLIHA